MRGEDGYSKGDSFFPEGGKVSWLRLLYNLREAFLFLKIAFALLLLEKMI